MSTPGIHHVEHSKTDDHVLFYYHSSVKIGEMERFVITYDLYKEDVFPLDLDLNPLWLKITNMEPISYRAAYLMGPYMLYCDVRTQEYHHSQKMVVSLDQPCFEPNLQAHQSQVAELSLHTIKKRYIWVVDVVSQILFSTTTSVSFQLVIGRDRDSIRSQFLPNKTPSLASYCDNLQVTRLTTLDIWKLPMQIQPKRRIKHLVILTHGLHSNTTVDMSYIQEQIYKTQDKYPDETIVVDGFPGNVCQTEKGVKYLGSRLAEYIVNKSYDNDVKKISFIGHSLGGLIQTFAIAYIAVKYSWFFTKVEPINFITLASPLLGIVTDNPAYIKLLLSFGVIGKTGQDLSLEENSKGNDPLLFLLPGEPAREILSKFKKRTLYANAINDGIVPLYTAGLLFMDYDSILKSLKESTDLKVEEDNITVAQNTDFFKKNFISPLTKMINVWAPQRMSNHSESLPKISILESATSILLPPPPDKTYIMDPDKRKNVIIHDRIYDENDLPTIDTEIDENLFNSDNILLKAFTIDKRERRKYQNLEKAIAKRWHKGMSWRKVIVALKPDAHNNIIVRRRFANAYGWPVIDHLIENHFNGVQDQQEKEDISDADMVVEQDKELILEDTCVNDSLSTDWITKIEKTSVFDEGPTGMISTVGEMLDKYSKRPIRVDNTINQKIILHSKSEDELLRYEEMNGDLFQ